MGFCSRHISGCPTVVCMDTELNRCILFNEGKCLIPGYPESMLGVLGRRNIAAVDGVSHKCIRGSMMSLISPLVMKEDLLPKIDTFVISFLNNWNGKTIDIQETTKEDEHFAIREKKKPGEAIDWNDYKSMNFTCAVIHETSSLATVNGLMRRTTDDVVLNEPFTFNPRRWLARDYESHNYCYIIGAGNRLSRKGFGDTTDLHIPPLFCHQFLKFTVIIS
ncbi:PLC-like phosphodiesterases superfamily protein [Hibiscus syriacus]|uniref:PLC-like phosphodiesterases superfamily protein n=1 Tax=Hibiscus syriacus TaxID=106335 RepID=A0A6A2ZIH8_HIBSY|nr:PLC-like phosphodiesterases superfamily protein [Hibiscus syriacus]